MQYNHAYLKLYFKFTWLQLKISDFRDFQALVVDGSIERSAYTAVQLYEMFDFDKEDSI